MTMTIKMKTNCRKCKKLRKHLEKTKEQLSSILGSGTRVFPGADIGSDHKLLLMAIRLKLTTKRWKNESSRPRWNLESLKNPGVAASFRVEVGGRFSSLNLLQSDCDVETLSGQVKEVLTSAAEKVLGRKKPTKTPWITKKILALCALRRELRLQRKESPEADLAYRKVHRKVRKNMKAGFAAYIETCCAEINNGIAWGDYRKAFALLRTLTRGKRKTAVRVEDKQGRLLRDKTQVLESDAQSAAETPHCSSGRTTGRRTTRLS